MFSAEPKQVGPVQTYDIAKISYPKQLQLETGYSQVNTWLSLVQEAAYKAKKGNCIVCAQARPNLILVETAFEYTNYGSSSASNTSDIDCLLQVMSQDNLDSKCVGWDKIYPVAPQNTTPPVFQPTMLTKATCFNNGNDAAGHFNVGRLPVEYCVKTYDLTGKEMILLTGLSGHHYHQNERVRKGQRPRGNKCAKTSGSRLNNLSCSSLTAQVEGNRRENVPAEGFLLK
ncbi:hypothetical protein GOODEAATRI_016212 [Goodea atripinnis]|uniref:Uncharacterized protein n=1 Tax=Goodea atripinnis TaxID=208336 RepID=A0ABV0MIA6_9TELE